MYLKKTNKTFTVRVLRRPPADRRRPPGGKPPDPTNNRIPNHQLAMGYRRAGAGRFPIVMSQPALISFLRNHR